jgi:hypothetical protein
VRPSRKIPRREDLIDLVRFDSGLARSLREQGTEHRQDAPRETPPLLKQEAGALVAEAVRIGLLEVVLEERTDLVQHEARELFADDDPPPHGGDCLEAFAKVGESREEDRDLAGSSEIGFDEGAGLAEGFLREFAGVVEPDEESLGLFVEEADQFPGRLRMRPATGDVKRVSQDAHESHGPQEPRLGEVRDPVATAIELRAERAQKGGLSAALSAERRR